MEPRRRGNRRRGGSQRISLSQTTGALAARLLKPDTGARIAMIETGGWDTHTGQRGRLTAQLKGLDAMVASLG